MLRAVRPQAQTAKGLETTAGTTAGITLGTPRDDGDNAARLVPLHRQAVTS